MIELVRELVPEVKGPPSGLLREPPPATAEDKIAKLGFRIRGELLEYFSAAVSKNDEEKRAIKDLMKAVKDIAQSQAEHGRQILGILKYLGLGPFTSAALLPQALADGRWRYPDAEDDNPQPRPPAPIPDWRARCEAEASKLEKELPELSTIAQLMERFGVSRTKIRNLIMSRKLPIVPLGDSRAMGIPRESVVAYVRAYGIPQPKPHLR